MLQPGQFSFLLPVERRVAIWVGVLNLISGNERDAGPHNVINFRALVSYIAHVRTRTHTCVYAHTHTL